MSIELYYPPDQSPLEGVETITISVWNGNNPIASHDFAIEERVGEITGVPENLPLRVVIEGKNSNGEILSRGRSGEFVLEKNKKKNTRIFFSRAGSFSKLRQDMSFRREFQATNIGDTSVILSGGINQDNKILNSYEIYFHDALSFAKTGTLNHARKGHSQIRIGDNIILFACGENDQGLVPEIEVGDPLNNIIVDTARLNQARKYATATLLDSGEVLFCGGTDGTSGLNTCEIFTPGTNTVKLLNTKMRFFRFNHTAILISPENILLSGGRGSRTIEVFNITSGSTQPPVELSIEREGFYADFSSQDKILFACGTLPGGIDLLNVTDFRIQTIGGTTPLPANCSAHVLLDGRLFVAGGESNGIPTDNAIILNVTTGSIEWQGRMLTKREKPAVVMLGDGTLLILGGSDSPPYAEIFNPP